MKLKISARSREIFAKKFLDLANIGVGTLLFGLLAAFAGIFTFLVTQGEGKPKKSRS